LRSLDDPGGDTDNGQVSTRWTFRTVYLAVVTGSLALLTSCAGVSASSKASAQPNQSTQYNVALSWNASSSSAIGYNLYRGTQSGGPYAKLNSSPLSATNYTDSNTSSGTTYYYVSTSVNAESQESEYSNQASVTIP